jgi:hypothetical protein
LPEIDGVVHSLGTLLEGGRYKKALKEGGVLSVLGSVLSKGDDNPLRRQDDEKSYEALNRDAGMPHCPFRAQPGNKQIII